VSAVIPWPFPLALIVLGGLLALAALAIALVYKHVILGEE